ncbi:GTPase-activating protein [Cadophora gregata]|uniref:GTPase-activating protein n=1 Tax=Cadophora gregata TaxID=51156 RepID=UPI0026DDBC1B|nr:GTPase-activating protein [Cadophora gregata]KAK0110140.1 GTPase-activating protein [Cadophora gregata]KAK0110244.1 GTPase-activating protein [Cadophora gregata f. sp. sojae]
MADPPPQQASQGAVPGGEGQGNMQVDIRNSSDEDQGLHLMNRELSILKRQIYIPDVRVGPRTLIRHATRNDRIIMSVSGVCAAIGGGIVPLMSVVFGALAQSFQDFSVLSKVERDTFNRNLVTKTLYLVYLAIGEYVCISISTFGFLYTGARITQSLRERYLAAILRQNVAFFDSLGTGEVINCITADLNLVQDGISEKVGFTITGLATFISAFVVGFIMYWKLSLILSGTLFSLLLGLFLTSLVSKKYSAQKIAVNATAAALSDEVFSSIRNTIAYNTQARLATQYDKLLDNASKFEFKLGVTISVLLAACMAIVELTYALAFWEGSRLLVNGEINIAKLLTTVLAIVLGSFALVNIAANFQAFAIALTAAKKIFSAIDRHSPLDSSSEDGLKLGVVEGTIQLQNVKHVYPSRLDVCVIDNLNLSIPAGKTTAIVGASGSGKSTIIGLIERFYEPVAGRVLIDGHDTSELNLTWMRQQIALVSQEPVLFGTTIYENIRYGIIGTPHENASPEVQDKLIIEAARQSNVHDFIMSLQAGYQTQVGERGILLSGGQKQRIAISRAIISDPKILLLDEATSALDTRSEGAVQAALSAVSKGRTTVVIAHRLSTIKDADNIVVMAGGRIVEQGTHDDLLNLKAFYYELVQAQEMLPGTSSGSEQDFVDSRLSDVDPNLNEKCEIGLEQHVPVLQVTTQKNSSWTLAKTVLAFNRKELPIMLTGVIFSILAGGTYPTQSLFFAKSISSLALPPSRFSQLRDEVNFWSWMYFMLAGAAFLSFLLQGLALGYCSAKLTSRVGSRAFRDIIRQDVSFFDREENTVGSLTSTLSTEPTNLSGFGGFTLGAIVSVISTIVSALALSIALSWKLGLVCGATIPLMLSSGFYRYWIMAQLAKRSKKAYAASASYAAEATSAIRTIASLTREKEVLRVYRESLTDERRKAMVPTFKSSNLYAVSQGFPYLVMALGFWYGGHLISRGEIGMFEFYVCYNSLIFTIQSAGRVLAFAPELGKAQNAALELMSIFENNPVIDSSSSLGEDPGQVTGKLEFRDVHFHYPNRNGAKVLKGLNFTVSPGQYVALVGASGCGKSTVLALLERFYDPVHGDIFIDDARISTLNLTRYRRLFALVSQEPTLYQGSIRDNILLGTDQEDPNDQALFQACKDADIYDFVMSLPDGFNTAVGTKGTLLSGGQKQRLAIARALIRSPTVLLLDEATSALDSESEKSVQAALENAMRGRTTIAVAHRLSTIQRADVIIVLDQGRVAEMGSHSELLLKRGLYFEMAKIQSLERAR